MSPHVELAFLFNPADIGRGGTIYDRIALKFLPGQTILEQGTAQFNSLADAQNAPLSINASKLAECFMNLSPVGGAQIFRALYMFHVRE